MTPRPVVIVRYGEIGLKGGNRPEFEKLLKRAVSRALRDQDPAAVERPRGRILVRDPRDPRAAVERVARIFGVSSTSPGLAVAPDLDAVRRAAVDLTRDALARRGIPTGQGLTFKVECRRADKAFPAGSMEVSRDTGAAVLQAFPEIRVRMVDPDLVVGVEIRRGEALVFAERHLGPGGLPIGSTGSAVTLLSGGLDSPVAAWLGMKRGLRLTLLHFHAAPFVGDASKQKAIDLARILSTWSGRLRLDVVPFADVQVAIKRDAPPSYRTILYRRAMYRIAARVAEEVGAKAYLTGESLGQVASQTLENLSCIGEAADRLVLRPLLTYDKQETIALAQQIGTYEASSRPHPDCCTLFQPTHPKIRGDLDEVRAIEERLDLAEAIAQAAAAREIQRFQEGEPLVRKEAPGAPSDEAEATGSD